MRNLLAAALLYIASGLSVIPIRRDGSKAPAIGEWKSYQNRRPTEAELRAWFNNDCGYGIAVIAGPVSGDLEIFDCDAPILFLPWCELVESICPGLLFRLVIVQTPSGGWHVYYRCSEIEGNQKLAQRLVEVPKDTDGARLIDERWVRIVTLLETRGAGGYALIPPTPPECHPDHRPYQLFRSDLTAIPIITPDERKVLLDAARSFNEYVRATSDNWTRTTTKPTDGTRPGDDFNNKADWVSLLTRHGWKYVHSWNNVAYWKRPGKSEPGISATTNYNGSNLLYCFSTNASPFEDCKGYSLFSAYCLLEHGGDFKAGAKALAAAGYGPQRKVIISPRLGPISKPKKTRMLEPVERPKDTVKLSLPPRPALTTLLDSEVTP